MAVERDNGVISENEETEKPVREQLKKASISQAAKGGPSMDAETTAKESEQQGEDGNTPEPREEGGRLQKKRSFDDFEGEQTSDTVTRPARHHRRKRSRDSTAEEEELHNGQRKSGERARDDADTETHAASNGAPEAPAAERPRTPEQTGDKRGEAAVEAMTSPKSKRSRLEENGTLPPETLDLNAPQQTVSTSESTEADKLAIKSPPTSTFASSSVTSPFGSLTRAKSPSAEPPQTSSSAFAASGFGSLASSSSSTSGFGAIGKTTGGFGTGGGFATGGKSPLGGVAAPEKETEASRPSSGSTFGGALGQKSTFGGASNGSAFGSVSSGFGNVGGRSAFGGTGFGSLGGSSGLSSFASGKPSATLSAPSKPSKGFGAPPDEDDEAEEADDADDKAGMRSPLSQESDKQDERFYEQDLETGEEDEKTEYSCRAKLYNFVAGANGKKEWKERGLGVVRLNCKKPAADEDEAKTKARLLMRAEGSHRVILNTPVKKELKFGAPSGGPPEGGYIYFMGTVDGKEGLELLQLKVRPQFAVELHQMIAELQEAM